MSSIAGHGRKMCLVCVAKISKQFIHRCSSVLMLHNWMNMITNWTIYEAHMLTAIKSIKTV